MGIGPVSGKWRLIVTRATVCLPAYYHRNLIWYILGTFMCSSREYFILAQAAGGALIVHGDPVIKSYNCGSLEMQAS